MVHELQCCAGCGDRVGINRVWLHGHWESEHSEEFTCGCGQSFCSIDCLIDHGDEAHTNGDITTWPEGTDSRLFESGEIERRWQQQHQQHDEDSSDESNMDSSDSESDDSDCEEDNFIYCDCGNLLGEMVNGVLETDESCFNSECDQDGVRWCSQCSAIEQQHDRNFEQALHSLLGDPNEENNDDDSDEEASVHPLYEHDDSDDEENEFREEHYCQCGNHIGFLVGEHRTFVAEPLDCMQFHPSTCDQDGVRWCEDCRHHLPIPEQQEQSVEEVGTETNIRCECCNKRLDLTGFTNNKGSFCSNVCLQLWTGCPHICREMSTQTQRRQESVRRHLSFDEVAANAAVDFSDALSDIQSW